MLMESGNNTYLTENLQEIDNPYESAPGVLGKNSQVGTYTAAFGIVAAMNLLCCIGCCFCGHSIKGIEEEDEDFDMPQAQNNNTANFSSAINRDSDPAVESHQ